MSQPGRITVLLADDHELFSSGLNSLLSSRPNIEVVAVANDGREAISLIDQLRPQVVLMDINMPNLNGIEAARQVTAPKTGDAPRVIGLSMHADQQFVGDMLRAGASGYLLKDSDFQELVTAIETVAAGNVYISPAVAAVLLQDYRQSTSPEADADGLTAREREVLQLLAEGKSTKQAARILQLSGKTIESHRRHILDKADCNGIADLTRYAIRQGITTADP